jgi:hypothetical protein
MSMETAFLALVVLQGLMGGFDTLVNHDLIERLPQRASARMEVGLHSLREAIYALLFAGLGWYTWHGAAVALVGGLLIAEFLVSTTDEYIENATRVLPHNERVLHAFLTLNLGLIIGIGSIVLFDRTSDPTGIVLRDPDLFTWALSALSLASLFWAVRDFSAWRNLLHRPILARRRS